MSLENLNLLKITIKKQLEEAQNMAKLITENLGGTGLFGVEFFICNGKVIFSELSPRPHDTGLVTLISQNLNEFELHIRAILGMPINQIDSCTAGASRVILAKEKYANIAYLKNTILIIHFDDSILLK